MKTWELVRFGFGQDSTLGALYEDTPEGRVRRGFTIEDERRIKKVPGETCIPVGTYGVILRTDGFGNPALMNGRYRLRHGERHKGMLWLQGVPDFEWVYIHIGNTEDQTKGCILPGRVPAISPSGEFSVAESAAAYWPIYESMASALIAGERVVLHITEAQPWA